MKKIVITGLTGLSLGVAACGGGNGTEPARVPVDEHAAAKSTPKDEPAQESKAHDTEAMPESVVQTSLEPLVAGVRPGGKVVLAAHFRITPGYRISWKYPGDVGQPTEVTFRAPEGFEVGPVKFPAPMRYTVPGNYTGYGYENETAVFVEVKAPSNVKRGAVHRFDLVASWVACKKQCATERTEAFVELATASGNVRVEDVEKALEPFRARIPKPLEDLKGAEQTWETGGRHPTLVVKLPHAKPVEFFPDGKSEPAPTKVALSDGEIRFRFDEAPRPGWRRLAGVVAVTLDGKDAFFDLEAAAPGEKVATR
jgi:thiol:disulfide interchange protein DsbD